MKQFLLGAGAMYAAQKTGLLKKVGLGVVKEPSKEDNLKMLKLLNKAMRTMPQSIRQKEIIAELNDLRSKYGLKKIGLGSVSSAAKEAKSVVERLLKSKKYHTAEVVFEGDDELRSGLSVLYAYKKRGLISFSREKLIRNYVYTSKGRQKIYAYKVFKK